jgi:predicted aspartyl protease
MSQSYPYDTSSRIPRLMRNVDVLHPTLPTHELSPARLDTGADITLIPEPLKDRLNLLPGGDVNIGGIRGGPVKQSAYYVRIIFEGFTWPVRVTTTDRAYVLIGLDILNNFKMYADGKARSFTLEDP